jgi:transcriptional regulator with GAF, ATPase, and Fis domain
MPELPSRDALSELRQALDAVLPAPIAGLVRAIDDARVQMLFWQAHGVGSYVVAVEDVPSALQQPAGVGQAVALDTSSPSAIEWRIAFAGASQVASVAIPNTQPTSYLWVGLADGESLTPEQIRGLTDVGARAAILLERPLSAGDRVARLQRLELASGLLPALMQVLDIREVLDSLSEISKQALPHDILTLSLVNDDLTRVTMQARSGAAPQLGGTFPQPYPPAAVRAWDFDIVDDHLQHPIERDRPVTHAGGRSSIRVQLRLGDRVIGGLGFVSFGLGTYSNDDVEIARRLADFFTVTLSHQQLAERARHNDELRAREANLEMLDQLLTSLIDIGDLRQVFERICVIAQKVLPHDGASLPVILPDGKHARIYARVGVDSSEPELVDVPEELRDNPEWEHEIVRDVSTRTEPHHVRLSRMGFRSLLRVPIRLEGKYGGAVIFGSRKLAAFSPPDVLIARRIADRLALLIARDRGLEASKRADEASERAARLESRVRSLTAELDARTGYRRVVGESTEWRSVLTQATQVAPNDTTVLLLGESGTGKEVVARFVHRASPRANGPFIALNCAALPEQLLEAELFGYERGAFTGAVQSKPGQLEQAAGGTLFLDEVGEMSLPAQAKFLRVLQEHEFQRLGGTRVLRTDARIIAATNRDLERAIRQNQFREDLYYRLNVFAIYLPALRDRQSDILPLSEAFLAEIGRNIARPAAGISREARERLLTYHWPGNVRELRNILERASILCEGGLINLEHLAIGLGARPPASFAPKEPAPRDVPEVPQPAAAAAVASAGDLKSLERDMIQQALQRVRFNKSEAARALGMTRHQLYVRMKRYGLD